MTSSTSLTSSGSSAEVGSSRSSIVGLGASARAIATRCCWPPDMWRGSASARSREPHAIEQLERPAVRVRARQALHPAQRAGDVLFRRQMAEQIEVLEHHADADRRPLVGDLARRQQAAVLARSQCSRPTTRMVPLSQLSRRLMQRRSVLLPEPLGPRSATTSPTRTVRSIDVEDGTCRCRICERLDLDRGLAAFERRLRFAAVDRRGAWRATSGSALPNGAGHGGRRRRLTFDCGAMAEDGRAAPAASADRGRATLPGRSG